MERVKEFAIDHIAVGARLEFRPVYGLPAYFVSSAGHVISAKRPKLKFLKTNFYNGYKRTSLLSAGLEITGWVHRMVLEAFAGPRPELDTRHKNGIRHDNRIENLEWGTAKENSADQARHGTLLMGIKHPRAKLTEDQVREIRSGNEPGRRIARRFNVSQFTVYCIRNGITWKHLK